MQPACAVIRGDRGFTDSRGPTWSLPANPEQKTVVNQVAWNDGTDVFRLSAGANDITLRNLCPKHIRWFLNIQASITGLTVEDVDSYNIQRFLEMPAGIGPSKFTFRRITGIGNSKAYFRMRGSAHHWTWNDVHINCGYQSGDRFARGWSILDTAHDAEIIDSSAEYCIEDEGTGYWQGDGASSERGNYDIKIRGSSFTNNGDGGLDLKSCNTTVDDTYSAGNKHDYRLWGGIGPSCTFGSVLTDTSYGNTIKRGGRGSRSIFHFASATVRTTVNHPIGQQPSPTAGVVIFHCQDSGGQATVNDTNDIEIGAGSLQHVGRGCQLTINPQQP